MKVASHSIPWSRKYAFIVIAVFLTTIVLFLTGSANTAKANWGVWGDASLIHGCKDSRGRVVIVAPTDSCSQHEVQVTWLRDVEAGQGLTISRDSSGVTLALGYDPSTGWTSSIQVWTYDSATSFTVPGDMTTNFQKGTRVKFTQTTTQYGVVKASAYANGSTTVALIENNDYSIANAAISSPYYSYQASPRGYPEWFSYTPSVYGTSGSVGSYSTLNLTGYFSVIGSKLTYMAEATVTNKGSWSGDIKMSIPVSANIGGGTFYYLWGLVSNDGDQANAIKAVNVSLGNGNNYLSFEKTFGAYFIQWSDVTATFRVASHGDVRF